MHQDYLGEYMNNHINLLFNFFNQYIDVGIKENIFDEFNKKSISIDFSSKSRKGDISSNFYLVTNKKIINKKFDLKNDLIKEINKLFFVENCEISRNGFININIKKDFLVEQIKILLEAKNKFGKSNLGNGKKVNVEFVSANPTGPLHVGHCRGAIFGDTLANLLKFNGHSVTREC